MGSKSIWMERMVENEGRWTWQPRTCWNWTCSSETTESRSRGKRLTASFFNLARVVSRVVAAKPFLHKWLKFSFKFLYRSSRFIWVIRHLINTLPTTAAARVWCVCEYWIFESSVVTSGKVCASSFAENFLCNDFNFLLAALPSFFLPWRVKPSLSKD